MDLSVHLEVSLGSAVDVRVLNDASVGFRYHAPQGRPPVVRDEQWLDEPRVSNGTCSFTSTGG